jgi:hypothetical protein
MTTEIKIARDFSTKPVGRYRADGPHTGEAFREDILIPALEKGDNVVVILDGTEGYPSSFLEEAFGGLVRTGLWTPTELKKRLQVRAETPPYEPYRDRVLEYIAPKRH